MKIAIVYVYTQAAQKYENYACRFLESYRAFPPGTEHESVVILNGTSPSSETTCLFSALPGLQLMQHDNSGYDIGGFQKAALTVPCDMMVFLGASTYFQRPGWLLRMAAAFQRHGNAQYGAMGNRGNLDVKVWPHIRTTAFWMDPKLMNAYPIRVTRPEQRHPFEHGSDCFTSWVEKTGLRSWVVTWTQELLWKNWDADPNGFHRGNQSALLAGDHISERPYYPNDRCRSAPALPCDPWRDARCWPCLSPSK